MPYRAQGSTSAAASFSYFFFFNNTATPEIYTLSLHDALPICHGRGRNQENAEPKPLRRPVLGPRRAMGDDRKRCSDQDNEQRCKQRLRRGNGPEILEPQIRGIGGAVGIAHRNRRLGLLQTRSRGFHHSRE